MLELPDESAVCTTKLRRGGFSISLTRQLTRRQGRAPQVKRPETAHSAELGEVSEGSLARLERSSLSMRYLVLMRTSCTTPRKLAEKELLRRASSGPRWTDLCTLLVTSTAVASQRSNRFL